MPMGASLSSDVYQYKLDPHLENIQNCMAIADDIIMFGFKEDSSDHDKTVRQVLNKAKSVGMRFNPNKCQFRRKEVKFFGLILSRHGVSPDPSKIEALKKLPEPKDEKLLQRFSRDGELSIKVQPKHCKFDTQLKRVTKERLRSKMD